MNITLELSEGEARWLIWLITNAGSTCGTSRDIVNTLQAHIDSIGGR